MAQLSNLRHCFGAEGALNARLAEPGGVRDHRQGRVHAMDMSALVTHLAN